MAGKAGAAVQVAPPSPNGDAEPFRVLVDARPVADAPSAAPGVRVRETPAEPGAGPRAPRREVEVAIDGYEGFTAWIWANYPRRILTALRATTDEQALFALLRQLADDPAFYDAVPYELAVLLVHAINAAPGVYPQSLARTSGI
jgi:hypothetical protein